MSTSEGSPVEIEGNEISDKRAKRALNKNENNFRTLLGRRDVKLIIHQGIMTKWQESWNNDTKRRDYDKIQKSVRVKRY